MAAYQIQLYPPVQAEHYPEQYRCDTPAQTYRYQTQSEAQAQAYTYGPRTETQAQGYEYQQPPILHQVIQYDDHPANSLYQKPTSPGSSLPISELSLLLDATVLNSWRDGSDLSLSHPIPYTAIELQIPSWPSSANIILARYASSKLKTDALYQLRGRWFIDTTGAEKSYFHVDDAVRFQGPGTIKSFRRVAFSLRALVVEVEVKGKGRKGRGYRVWVRWETRDPYKKDVVVEQMARLSVELDGGIEALGGLRGRVCEVEGWMDGGSWKCDWICSGIRMAE